MSRPRGRSNSFQHEATPGSRANLDTRLYAGWSRAAVIGLLPCFVFGCGEPSTPGKPSTAPLSALVPQRVDATVQRRASRLIHVQTEHETFVVTPEHPFATPDAHWIAAGSLSRGDLVQSARSGSVRVSAVREETLLRPVPVFNLSVAHTHAYLVGTDSILVHNAGCKDKGKAKDEGDITHYPPDLEAARRELESLGSTGPESVQGAEQRRQRMAELSAFIVSETLKRIVALRIEIANNRQAEEKAGKGKDDSTLLERRAELMEQLAEIRVRELRRRGQGGTGGWMYGTGEDLDGARLRAIRDELARGNLSEARLNQLEQELTRSEPITREYLAAIWRELDVVSAHENLDGLRNELDDAFKNFEAEDAELRTASARGERSARRTIEKRRAQLRKDWRQEIRLRIEAVRQRLRSLQTERGRRKERLEPALAGTIALLERELHIDRFALARARERAREATEHKEERERAARERARAARRAARERAREAGEPDRDSWISKLKSLFVREAPSLRRLREELREERRALLVQEADLERRYAAVRNDPASSNDTHQLLNRILDDRARLHQERWTNLQRRISERQRRLDALLRATPRDDNTEAELEAEIALLERELLF